MNGIADTDQEQSERGGVLAAEVVLRVLDAFVGAEPQIMLKTLAKRAQMHPAKVHRYLVSLCRLGFVRQDPETNLYQLAGGALDLGLAAMDAIDPVAVARPALQTLREETQLSAILALWESAGPIVALQELQPAPLMLVTRVGSALPLLATATGLVFCAWLPRFVIERALEHASDGKIPPEAEAWLADPASMETVLADIRRAGVAWSTGQMNASVHGLSAPVFDISGHLVAVISIMGPAGQVDLDLEGPTAQRLKDCAQRISLELGWRPGTEFG